MKRASRGGAVHAISCFLMSGLLAWGGLPAEALASMAETSALGGDAAGGDTQGALVVGADGEWLSDS